MREVARWQSWPKEGESETENHESAELQSDQIKEMSKTSKAAKRQSAIKSLDSWLSHGSWSGFAAGAPCGYGYELLLGTRGTPAIYSKMHNICRLGMHIVLGPQSRQGNFA